MKKYIILILLISFSLLGCSNQNPVIKENPNNKSLTETEKQAPEQMVHSSISNYVKDVKGQNFKTGALEITQKNNLLFFDMDFVLLPALEKEMLNTKNPIYINFTDIDGREHLSNAREDKQPFIKMDFEKMKSQNGYHITQVIPIKQNVSPDELKSILSPNNYQLEFFNEKGKLVAVIIGLSNSTIY